MLIRVPCQFENSNINGYTVDFDIDISLINMTFRNSRLTTYDSTHLTVND